MVLNAHNVPVFAFPPSLKFYLATRTSHTQILTLYSPYDFPIKYKVHCHSSAWDKYTVPTPEGTIPGQSSVDLIITHKQPVPSNCNITDKFKIIIQDPVSEQIIGQKSIKSILLPGEHDLHMHNDDEDDELDDEFYSQRCSQRTHSTTTKSVYTSVQPTSITGNNQFISSIVIAVCAIILFLPTEVEVPKLSILPTYMQVSHKVQLLAALLLGVFLCILVRS